MIARCPWVWTSKEKESCVLVDRENFSTLTGEQRATPAIPAVQRGQRSAGGNRAIPAGLKVSDDDNQGQQEGSMYRAVRKLKMVMKNVEGPPATNRIEPEVVRNNMDVLFPRLMVTLPKMSEGVSLLSTKEIDEAADWLEGKKWKTPDVGRLLQKENIVCPLTNEIFLSSQNEIIIHVHILFSSFQRVKC